jgi:hypothetical protein
METNTSTVRKVMALANEGGLALDALPYWGIGMNLRRTYDGASREVSKCHFISNVVCFAL